MSASRGLARQDRSGYGLAESGYAWQVGAEQGKVCSPANRIKDSHLGRGWAWPVPARQVGVGQDSASQGNPVVAAQDYARHDDARPVRAHQRKDFFTTSIPVGLGKPSHDLAWRDNARLGVTAPVVSTPGIASQGSISITSRRGMTGHDSAPRVNTPLSAARQGKATIETTGPSLTRQVPASLRLV